MPLGKHRGGCPSARNINRRRCTVIRKDGSRCNGIAVTDFPRCFHHGGSGVLARRGLYKRKLRYRAWTDSKSEIERHERGRRERLADLFDWPKG
jgi:hypothetical protein